MCMGSCSVTAELHARRIGMERGAGAALFMVRAAVRILLATPGRACSQHHMGAHADGRLKKAEACKLCRCMLACDLHGTHVSHGGHLVNLELTHDRTLLAS